MVENRIERRRVKRAGRHNLLGPRLGSRVIDMNGRGTRLVTVGYVDCIGELIVIQIL
jgi:hypothetical protein